MNDAPSATTKVKRIVSTLSAEPEACASPAITALIRTRLRLNATRGSRAQGSTKEMPANSAARPARSRICVVSEPGILSGPIVAMAPARAIAPHTAAAMRPMSSLFATTAFMPLPATLIGRFAAQRKGAACSAQGGLQHVHGPSTREAHLVARRARPERRCCGCAPRCPTPAARSRAGRGRRTPGGARPPPVCPGARASC